MNLQKSHTRRFLLVTGAGLAAIAFIRWPKEVGAATESKAFEVEKTDAEWQRILTPAQYDVLRRHGTERAGLSPLNHEKRKGVFACAGCDLPLFSSETKFDSGTGWPSYYEPLPNAVGTSEDRSYFMVRTEVHCRRCGGHLGHVFDDGPKPTGLRYCINGVALKFLPAETAAPPA
ncbi:MAG: peptide-methionine (R)-S-oxide reductase MsrB [Xanthobacteraceae bacterium]